jgi:predicted enzyme related to lactoylglutathione lyase
VYVTDTDAASAPAVRLGGAVILAPEDTPYGGLAALTGPSGERFWLMSTDEPGSPPRV